ncbi:unnamed protein product [Nippostrongylus brasiliensis]|uniref:G protein-coupled receptor n=1 Tax=Nippostrongylus brasiliensis TaxID=27835 RepID=A0A0N4Y9K5_NIPBR|nr:unnamed protein product [Nippostrongylus brasiliensis]
MTKPDDISDTLSFIFYPIEFLLNATALVETAFLIYIANRLRDSHLNLRILLAIACLCFLTFVVTRMITIPFKLLKGCSRKTGVLSFLDHVHDDAFVVFTIILLVTSLERLLATWSISTYERRFQSKLYLIVVVVSVINVVSYYLNRRSSNVVLTAALSHKFQLKENLAALTVLVPIAFLWSVMNIVQICCLWVMYSGRFAGPDYRILVRTCALIFCQAAALFAVAAPLIFMIRHPRLRRRLETVLLKKASKQSAVIRMSPKQEADIYFRALQSSLNTASRSKK